MLNCAQETTKCVIPRGLHPNLATKENSQKCKAEKQGRDRFYYKEDGPEFETTKGLKDNKSEKGMRANLQVYPFFLFCFLQNLHDLIF
jgi:hypothetical protein